MPTNRLVVKEQIATYAQTLFDAAYNAGGQDGVLEVRDQAKKIIAAVRENADFQSALKDSSYSPEQRASVARGVFEGFNPALVDVVSVMAERAEAELFAKEVSKNDPNFFLRLKESKYHFEDKSLMNEYILFNDKDYTDKDYFKEYPTILSSSFKSYDRGKSRYKKSIFGNT